MNLLFLIIIIVVIVIAVFLYIRFANSSSTDVSPLVVNRGPYNLKGGIQVVKASDLGKDPNAFLTEGEGAFQCFVYLDGNVRTGNASDCGTDPALPSCGTGLYQECQCGNDLSCQACKHPGYKSLINLYDTFKIEVLTQPDASRQNSVSAQIVVKTTPSQDGNGNNSYAIETFPLPPLPEQKWTMITVSKQGRQIFVYYNGTLILSKKALHTFSVIPPASQIPVYAGDATLSGNIAMITFYPSHQGIPDVANQYSSMVDTRGNLNSLPAVPTSSSYKIEDTSPSAIASTLCLDGSCLKMRSAPTTISTIPSIYSPLETSYA